MYNKMLAAFIALLGLNGAAAAQTPTCAAPKIAGKPIDLQAVPGGNLLTVPVDINGTPKQFLLDIGTDPDAVAATTVTDLHLPQVAQTNASNPLEGANTPYQFGTGTTFFDVKAGGKAVDFQTRVRVASVAVAGATVENWQFVVANDRDMGKSKPYDGRFTGSLFPQYDMNFNFGAKQLSFVDPTSCQDPNQVAYWPHAVVAVIPMTIENNKMHVEVMIQGHAIDAIIDMGSDRTVMRRGLAEQTLGLSVDKDMTPDGDRTDGMGQQIYVHTFPQVSFGGVSASNVPAVIQANSMVRKLNKTPVLGSRATFNIDPGERVPDLALGMDVLHQLHIYAAFNQNKLYVTPAE